MAEYSTGMMTKKPRRNIRTRPLRASRWRPLRQRIFGERESCLNLGTGERIPPTPLERFDKIRYGCDGVHLESKV